MNNNNWKNKTLKSIAEEKIFKILKNLNLKKSMINSMSDEQKTSLAKQILEQLINFNELGITEDDYPKFIANFWSDAAIFSKKYFEVMGIKFDPFKDPKYFIYGMFAHKIREWCFNCKRVKNNVDKLQKKLSSAKILS